MQQPHFISLRGHGVRVPLPLRSESRQGDVVQEMKQASDHNARDLVKHSEALKPDEKVLLQVWSEGKSGYIAVQR